MIDDMLVVVVSSLLRFLREVYYTWVNLLEFLYCGPHWISHPDCSNILKFRILTGLRDAGGKSNIYYFESNCEILNQTEAKKYCYDRGGWLVEPKSRALINGLKAILTAKRLVGPCREIRPMRTRIGLKMIASGNGVSCSRTNVFSWTHSSEYGFHVENYIHLGHRLWESICNQLLLRISYLFRYTWRLSQFLLDQHIQVTV